MSDLISRQDAIDALRVAYWDKNIQSAKDDPCIVDAMTDWAIRQIKALPSAERTGHWIHQTQYNRIQCSVCETVYRNTFAPKNFCPNCGADMRGEEDDSR